MTGYPLTLRLAGRRVVVVGGGAVAARRLPALLDAGADVTLIAPAVDPALAVPAPGPGGGSVTFLRRSYAGAADLEGAVLVHACTDDRAVNAAVAADAAATGRWCVRADDATASDAWVPATGQVDDVLVAVTAGRDPRRAARLRDAVVDLLRSGDLPVRRVRTPTGTGRVAFVRVPADPDLLTLRAARLLAAADVVVVDPTVPWTAPDPAVEVAPVPNGAGAETIMASADRGLWVVRLTGSGGAAAEIAACAGAGVPYEVVGELMGPRS